MHSNRDILYLILEGCHFLLYVYVVQLNLWNYIKPPFSFILQKATHLFVDEAGQSCEPDVLIPWTRFLSREIGQVVLAGDPMQLRPVVKSLQAQFLKLPISMIERLMAFDLYKRDARGIFNPRYVVQLTKNYRSHPKLLKVPNELFYENRLEPCADIARTHQMSRWTYLPKSGFPMIFQSVHSRHSCPRGSTSLMNAMEVYEVIQWVEKLLRSGNNLRPVSVHEMISDEV